MNSTPPTEAERPLLVASPVPALLSEAVDLARTAAEEDAGDQLVGDYVGLAQEDEASVTHLFDAAAPGYRGWRWAVTVAWGGPDTEVTVSEVVLLPGPDALVAPDWVPWQERVQAGDLGVGDLMPTAPDDPRLVPAYLASDDEDVEQAALELGLGRVRVMARAARLDAAQRWQIGEFGPRSDMARGAPGHCGTCGFYLPVAGSLRAAFGVCGNEIAPADGHLVHAEYGCGAHSEAEVEQVSPVLVADLIYDDNALLDIEVIERPESQQSDEAGALPQEVEPAEAQPEGALAEPRQVAESAERQLGEEPAESRQQEAEPAEVRPQAEQRLQSDEQAESRLEVEPAGARPEADVQPEDVPAEAQQQFEEPAEPRQQEAEPVEERHKAEPQLPSNELAEPQQPESVPVEARHEAEVPQHEAEPLRQNDELVEARQAVVEPAGARPPEAEPQRPVDAPAEVRHQGDGPRQEDEPPGPAPEG